MTQPSSESVGSTSSGLLARVRLHDPEAWRRLAQIYGPLVYHWCRTSRLQPDVFRAVARHVGDFRHDRPGDSFRGWLRVISRNKVLDWQRQMRRQPRAAGGTDAHQRLMTVSDPIDADAFESPLAEETNLLFKSGSKRQPELTSSCDSR